MLTRDESLLLNVTLTPPAGAGVPSEIGKGADWPRLRPRGDRVIAAGATTVTVRAAGDTLGPPAAWITVVPPLRVEAVRCAKVLLAGIVTVGGTLTTLGLSDVSVTT
jgi:hypothetical protein